jgi:hypothetical protein
MNPVYFTNFQRNKIICELWEKNLTVEQTASSTGIPRSTVGYYFRKFNRLAAQGKPVVFPGSDHGAGAGALQDSLSQESSTMSIIQLYTLDLIKNRDWKELYYRLRVFKLMKELGFFKGEDRQTTLLLLTVPPDSSTT